MLAKKLQVWTVAIAQVQFAQWGQLSITAEVAGKVRNRAGPMLSAESGYAQNVVDGLDLQPALGLKWRRADKEYVCAGRCVCEGGEG